MIKKILLLITTFVAALFLTAATNQTLFGSFDQLPETTGIYDKVARDKSANGEIGIVNFKEKSSNRYDIEIKLNDRVFVKRNAEIPYNRNAKKEFTGYYWTEKEDDKVNRFLVYYTDGSNKSLDKLRKNLENEKIEPFKIQTIWNLTTGKFYTYDKIKTYGFISEISGNYFYNLAIPIPMDDVILVDMDFDYTERFWFGIKKSNHKNLVVRREETVEAHFHAPTWLKLRTLLLSALMEKISVKVDRIVPVEMTPEIKAEYINKFNEQLSKSKQNGKNQDLNYLKESDVISGNSKYYRIYVQELSSFFSTSISFENIIINDVVYEHKGQVFNLNIDNIIQYSVNHYPKQQITEKIGDALGQALASIKKFMKQNKWYFIGAGILVGLGFLIYLFGPAIREGSKVVGETTRSVANSAKERRKNKDKKKKK